MRSIKRTLSMATLVVTGEAIFFLPFVLPRIFRPTMLEVFDVNNLQLGLATMVYGIVAMLAYFPGGPLADRFQPRNLMTLALVATAASGLALLSYPSATSLAVLYGIWGLTTILLFWAPLIRATRHWGGGDVAGQAFGLLDGGRGLIAAIIAGSSVYVFSLALPAGIEDASLETKRSAFRWVIGLFILATMLAAALAYWCLGTSSSESSQRAFRWQDAKIRSALTPAVWLQAAIVICAYVGYKGLDYVSQYAKEVLEFDELQAANLGTATMWCRPPAAIFAGILADRWSTRRLTQVCFAGVAVGFGLFATGMISAEILWVLLGVLLTTSAAVFALRGLYFAIMDEGGIPTETTGLVVGIVSAVGYTPDVFMGPLCGWLLDRSPGLPGHQQVFGLLSVFALLGFAASVAYPGKKQKEASAASKRVIPCS